VAFTTCYSSFQVFVVQAQVFPLHMKYYTPKKNVYSNKIGLLDGDPVWEIDDISFGN